MTDIIEFLGYEEFSNIIMNALSEKYKKSGEWEFTIDYKNKKIETLELWKTKHRYNKDKYVLDLTKIFTEFQIKQLFLIVILKFEPGTFE